MRLALAALAAVSLLAAACGGTAREPNLAKAAERTEATGSTRMEIRGHFQELGERLETRCEGAADYERRRFRMACDIETPSDVGGFEWREIGNVTYERSEPGEKYWTRMTNDDDEGAGHTFSPQMMLDLLRSASVQTERLGEEHVRGEETVHYGLTVKCEAAELADCEGDTALVGVWIDDDGLVRRIRIAEPGEIELEFFDFGAEVEIEPPPEDQVRDWKPPPVPRCTDAEASPISVPQALAVLRRHGFEMTRGEFGCSAGISASLSSGFDAPEHLSCFVLTTPRSDGPNVVVTQSTTLGGPPGTTVDRNLRNLECTLFLTEDQSDEAVERLERALAELKRAIRP